MKGIVLTLVLLLAVPAVGQVPLDPNVQPPAVPVAPVAEPAVQPGPIGAPTGLYACEENSPEGLRRLTRRERKDLGLTIFNMRRKAQELHAQGIIDKSMDRAVISALIFDAIAADNETAFADPTVDWDAILEFIEALLPIILAFINAFSYLTPEAATTLATVFLLAMPRKQKAA